MKTGLRERMAADITLSDDPGGTIRKWRIEFEISQNTLAKELRVSPSVISDYESGRRSSPGIKTVRKIVEALLRIDETAGKRFSRTFERGVNSAILGIREFRVGIPADIFIKEIEGENLSREVPLSKNINGYTILDSLKAITALGSSDFLEIYGWSSQRALIFTGVTIGRSPMVAVRAHPLKPAMVVYVRPQNVDELAIRLAELEGVSLVRTELETSDLIGKLERL